MTYLDDRLGVAGRVAVLIGGAGGLGLACATELGRAGMRLAIGDIDEARLASTAAALAGEGIEVHAGALDCRDIDALDRVLRLGRRCLRPRRRGGERGRRHVPPGVRGSRTHVGGRR